MIGELVPLVMIPRFTSFLGPTTFSTNPLDVSEYERSHLEFWRGELAGSAGSPVATFTAHFEEANEPDPPGGAWTIVPTPGFTTPITTANANSLVTPLNFTKKYFRIRIVLTGTSTGHCGITCWAAGNLEKRIPVEAGA